MSFFTHNRWQQYEKVKVDNTALPGFLGATSTDGVLRIDAPLTYTDGGDYITLGLDVTGNYTFGSITVTEGGGIAIGGTPVADKLIVQTSNIDDPQLCLKNTNTAGASVAHEVCFALDESAAADHVDFIGQTASIDTYFHVVAQSGQTAKLGVQQGSYRGELIMGAAGAVSLRNVTSNLDLILGINDGGVAKSITWDAANDKLKHSHGTFDFDDDHIVTTGTLGCGALTSGNIIIPNAGYIGSVGDTDAMQIEADGDIVMTQDLAVTGTLNVSSNLLSVGEVANKIGVGTATPDELLEVEGNVHLDDNYKILLGTGKDASIYYDGTHMYVNSGEVGSGYFAFLANSGAQDIVSPIILHNTKASGDDVGAGFLFTSGTGGLLDDKIGGFLVQWVNYSEGRSALSVRVQDGTGERFGVFQVGFPDDATGVAKINTYATDAGTRSYFRMGASTVDTSTHGASEIGTLRTNADASGDSSMVLRTASAGTLGDRMTIDHTGNVGIGTTTFGTNAATVFAQATGTAPTSSPVDMFQMYSADVGGAAGKAGVHFRDEAGNVTSIGDGKILDSGGAISFGNENLSTTGTASAGASDFGDGGTTNYASFAADGELNLFGTARVTKTADIDIGRVKLPGVNQPGEGTEDNFSTLDFNKASDEEVYLHWHIPYSYTDAGNIDVHFYFFADAQPGSDEIVRWGVEYKKISVGDVFDFDSGTSGDTTGTTVANADPAKTIYKTGNMSLTTTGFVGGDHILFRFYRDADGTSGTDDLDQDARMFRIHVEYLMNKLGQATT